MAIEKPISKKKSARKDKSRQLEVEEIEVEVDSPPRAPKSNDRSPERVVTTDKMLKRKTKSQTRIKDFEVESSAIISDNQSNQVVGIKSTRRKRRNQDDIRSESDMSKNSK